MSKNIKKIKRTITTTYEWWNDGDIKPEHIEALEEHAIEHIYTMTEEGYTCGDLNVNIYMTDDDPDDGVDYSGWWNQFRSDELESNDKDAEEPF